MMRIDFEERRPPTRREANLYRQWLRYLKNSKLPPEEQKKRAADLTIQKQRVPKD